MINVQMSDDIRKFETKVISFLTFRQLICVFIGLLYSIPLSLLIKTGWETRIIWICLFASPAVAMGFIKWDGLHFEGIVLRILYMYILTPSKRKVICKNPYREGIQYIKDKEEKAKLDKMTPAQQKKYKKLKEQKKVVRYNFDKSKEDLKIYK